MELYFTYPGWKRKALSFSYDDARVEDRRMVGVLNAHGLKGSFNISPGRLGLTGFISRDEVKTLYTGHEIASHGYSHLHLTHLPPEKMRAELVDGRRALEDLLGRPVTGFASAYGGHTDATMAAMREAGFAYARPVTASGGFSLPYDPMFWTATVHHDKGSIELAKKFLANAGWGGTLLFMNIWGHSFEFERNGNWELLDEICSLFDGHDEIWSATNLEVCEYVSACRCVKITLDGQIVRNTSAIPLYANWGESHGTQDVTKVILPPGEEIDLAAYAAEQKRSSVAKGRTCEIYGGGRQFDLAFPDWKRKALTFSYDDAPPCDRPLVEIFNRYGMKATFNINTHGRPDAVPADCERDAAGRPTCLITKSEWKTLYAGHEIALHGARHDTYASTPWPVIVEDIYRNKQVIEAELRTSVRGFAYPCGNNSKTPEGDQILRALDVAYGRVVSPPDRKFSLPDDFLDWHPTAHHNGGIEEIGREFLEASAASEPLLCYIWGHSFEFGGAGNWDVMERFCALMANKPEIWYATNIQICDYVTAARKLIWSVKHDSVKNPTATDIYGFIDGQPCVIPAGYGMNAG